MPTTSRQSAQHGPERRGASVDGTYRLNAMCRVPAVGGVLILFYYSRALPLWKRFAMAGVLLALVAASYALPMVQKRINHGLASVDAYFASDDFRDDSRLGTFGSRMELWKTGWYIFLENPVLGAGVGGFKVEAAANWKRYEVNDYVKRKKYVHNQYLAALATRGIPGLILFLLVMLTPVYIAMQAKSDEPGREVARLSLVMRILPAQSGCCSAKKHPSSPIFFPSGSLSDA